jgi:hypothetical protein
LLRLLRPPARASIALHGAPLTSATGAWFGSAFSSERRDLAPLTSDASLPLPRRRVNDTGFDVSPKHLPSARSPALRSRRQPQPTTFLDEPTTLTDFCNRRNARAHPRTIVTRRPAAFHGRTLLLAERRRRAMRTDRPARESAPRKARPPTTNLERTSLSRAAASTHWSVRRGSSGARQGPPGVRRANERTFGKSRDAFSCAGSVRFYSTRSGRTWRADARLARASSHPRLGVDR